MLREQREKVRGQINLVCIDDLAPADHILRDIEAAMDFNPRRV